MHLDAAPGTPPSFDVVALAARHAIRAVLRRLHIPERDRDDVVQKILLALFQHLPAYDPSRPLGPWLRTVAFRTARDHRALACQRHEDLAASSDVDVEDGAPDSEQRVIDRQTFVRVDELLQGIDDARRSVLVMYYLDGRPIAEIAESLGIPFETARTRLRLGRADLKAAWEGAHPRDG